MGKKSVKENKSIYQVTRENLGLTREQASERIGVFSPEKIERIENGKVNVLPEDVKDMAAGYKAPELCNYYCANECAIGMGKIPVVEEKSLEKIALETLSSINKLNREKDRLIEIVDDGVISPDEYEDFVRIKDTLDKITHTVHALNLWIDKMTIAGELNLDKE